MSEKEGIPLGQPFVVCAEEVELLPAGADYPGCVLCVACKCGEAFELDLLDETYKACPGCHVEYTHVLVIGRRDDRQLANDLLEEIVANQDPPPVSQAEQDDGADDEEDDDEEDDDGNDDGDPRAPVRRI